MTTLREELQKIILITAARIQQKGIMPIHDKTVHSLWKLLARDKTSRP